MSEVEVERFWMEDPWVLLNHLNFLPMKTMTQDEKLNALTRLAIIITVGLYFMKNQNWLYFLLGSVLVIVFVKCTRKIEGFAITPLDVIRTTSSQGIASYSLPASGSEIEGPDAFEDTRNTEHPVYVSPAFTEEWQVNPQIYDSVDVPDFSQNPDDGLFSGFDEPPRSGKPYAQYLTRTNLLPSDEDKISGGAYGTNAREYANSSFTRNSIAFRENMMSVYKKKLNRRFKHNCNDTFSPFNAY